MNNQEKTVHEYLSGYFGVDLNESIDSLTESDIIDAVQDLNALVIALNERSASFGKNSASKGTWNWGRPSPVTRDDIQKNVDDRQQRFDDADVFNRPIGTPKSLFGNIKTDVSNALQSASEYRDLLAKRIASKGGKLDPKTADSAFTREFEFEAQLPGRVRAEVDRLDAKHKADYDKKFTDVTPFERAKNAMKLMDKPDGSFGTHGEKNRKNLKPKFEKEVDKRSRLERAGMDPNREDYDAPDTQLSAHAGIVAQERKADKKRRGVTPNTSDYRLPGGATDYAAMARDMRESRTLREQSGGASMYPVIPRRDNTRKPEDQAAYEIRQKNADAELARSTAERNAGMTPEQIRARSENERAWTAERRNTPDNQIRRQAKQDHKDRVKVELVNNARGRRGMGPLGANDVVGTQASNAAAQKTIQDRYAAAAAKRTARFGDKEPTATPPATTAATTAAAKTPGEIAFEIGGRNNAGSDFNPDFVQGSNVNPPATTAAANTNPKDPTSSVNAGSDFNPDFTQGSQITASLRRTRKPGSARPGSINDIIGKIPTRLA